MTARHWASPVRVPWSSTRLHRLRACISNLDWLSCIVTLTVTMSAGSSRHLSRFPALSTISADIHWHHAVERSLPLGAAAAPFHTAGEWKPLDDARDHVAEAAKRSLVERAYAARALRRKQSVHLGGARFDASRSLEVSAWLHMITKSMEADTSAISFCSLKQFPLSNWHAVQKGAPQQ